MLNQIRDNKGARYKFKRVGRGIASGKGKTCGRGHKGQKSRSGVALAGYEGGQNPLYMRLPKRGFNSINKTSYAVVNVADIEAMIANKKLGNKITISDLQSTGVLQGKGKKIKLLGNGEIKSKFSIEVHAVSKSVKDQAEKLGCSITLVE
jgi:large subunit ribosomal protein L15